MLKLNDLREEKMRKADYILIIFLIVISAVSFFFMVQKSEEAEHKYASVKIDGIEVKRIFFSKETIGKIYVIESEYGKNVVEMDKDRVHIIEASCPDKLDVKQGYITRPGEIIVCLPNHLTVEIVEDHSSKEVDIVGR